MAPRAHAHRARRRRLYTGAGLYALLLLVLPGTMLTHRALVVPLGVGSVVYGLLSMFVLDWRTLPGWVLRAGTFAALFSTALSVYATGGFDSPVEQIPVFVVVYSACFLSSRFTVLCVVGAVAVHELPLLYDAHARVQSVAADSLSAVLVFAALAVVVVAGLLGVDGCGIVEFASASRRSSPGPGPTATGPPWRAGRSCR